MIRKEHLLLRADADERTGTGHVMRSLALAQAWRDAGGQVSCLVAALPSRLWDRLEREGVSVKGISSVPGSEEDAEATLSLARRMEARLVACDGYAFGQKYQRVVRESGVLLLVDDTGELGPYEADVVLNQNLGANEALYPQRARHTELLLGPRYILLRREFLKRSRALRGTPDQVRRLLVTMGGSDPVGATALTMRALARLPGLEVAVVVGPANPRQAEIVASAERIESCRVVTDVSDLTELFEWADLAVTGAGSTCWELAFSGVPFVTVALADNQRIIAESLEMAGVARYAGWHVDVDEWRLAEMIARLAAEPEARAAMTAAGRNLVDGRGAERVARRLARALAA